MDPNLHGRSVWVCGCCLPVPNSIILITYQLFIWPHNDPIDVYLLHRLRCDVFDASNGSVSAQKAFNATFNVAFAENSNLSRRALCDGG